MGRVNSSCCTKLVGKISKYLWSLLLEQDSATRLKYELAGVWAGQLSEPTESRGTSTYRGKGDGVGIGTPPTPWGNCKVFCENLQVRYNLKHLKFLFGRCLWEQLNQRGWRNIFTWSWLRDNKEIFTVYTDMSFKETYMTLFNEAFKNTYFVQSNDPLEESKLHPFRIKRSSQLVCVVRTLPFPPQSLVHISSAKSPKWKMTNHVSKVRFQHKSLQF